MNKVKGHLILLPPVNLLSLRKLTFGDALFKAAHIVNLTPTERIVMAIEQCDLSHKDKLFLRKTLVGGRTTWYRNKKSLHSKFLITTYGGIKI